MVEVLVQDEFITAATTHLASSLASLDTVSSTLLAFLLCANVICYITPISIDKAMRARYRKIYKMWIAFAVGSLEFQKRYLFSVDLCALCVKISSFSSSLRPACNWVMQFLFYKKKEEDSLRKEGVVLECTLQRFRLCCCAMIAWASNNNVHAFSKHARLPRIRYSVL